MTAFSPEPVCCTLRTQPGLGANESIEKPLGTVSSTPVVVAFSFSVGTASVNTSPDLASATGGLTRACAAADGASASPAPAAASAARRTCICFVFLSVDENGDEAARRAARACEVDGKPAARCERRHGDDCAVAEHGQLRRQQ